VVERNNYFASEPVGVPVDLQLAVKLGYSRLLLLMANFGKEGRPQPILAKISQETLAEMIGTTVARQPLHEQVP
jgi:hypothetical protein